jgi:hypothetical protein
MPWTAALSMASGVVTERERRALLRRRPNVASWRVLLEDARADHTHVHAPKRGDSILEALPRAS